MKAYAHQRGMSMLIALIALVAMSLTAVALVRSVDTGTLIIGNFAFKQDATEASATGAQAAMQWLSANKNALNADDPDHGYYASSIDTLDPTGSNTSAAKPLDLVDWAGDGDCATSKSGTFSTCTRQAFPKAVVALAAPVNGNTTQWIITRLCKNVGEPGSMNPCLTPNSVSHALASDRGELTSGGRIASSTQTPYYRIMVRSAGPRNTVSFTETIVHF